MVVVADTSPINYLVLIDRIDLLGDLYDKVLIPQPVLVELTSRQTPPAVLAWIGSAPPWLEIRSIADGDLKAGLDAGEDAAIRLALTERSLLLIDEQPGRTVANRFGIPNIGTLGVLVAASNAGLIDLRPSIEKLRQTNFRIGQDLIEKLLKLH